VERRWRCVQHFFFSCNASPLDCSDPTDLWLDLLDLLSCDSFTALRVREAPGALHVDSFHLEAVRPVWMLWLLDPFCFLSACTWSVCAAVCSVLACYVCLVGASVADAAVPACAPAFAAGLVRSSLRRLSFRSTSRVAGRCPPYLRPAGGAEAEALVG
jgi:hypothetical protein